MKKILSERMVILLFAFMLFTVISGPALAGEYSVKDLNEQLVMSTLWCQRSAEMRAISYQTFNMAKMVFDLDMQKGPSSKPRAVVMDVDETLLDNSPYEAGVIGKDYGYPRGWDEWVYSARAEARPGAVEFLRYVREKGGDVYYLSNRKAEFRHATVSNLRRLGFPQVDDDHLFLRSITYDKIPRKKRISSDHNIVVMIGDNINDFDDIFRDKEMNARMAAVDLMKDHFGTKFIVLPNPI